MKVLVAGATGAIGRQLVPKLVAGEHEVRHLGPVGNMRAMLRRGR